MSINTAYNINRAVGCDKCARREECQAKCPMLALLVFLNGVECGAKVAKEVVE